ncbi:MAG: aldehyde dehydrogenase family protein [Candidatus Wallbacteria bacterium]|nr:aldehyde dehydrogenase family protein [Candidatus Wallbacteria bacterium]
MAEVYKNYIDGEWIESSSRERYSVVNPANTSDVVGEFQRSTPDDARRAIQAAQAAFKPWSAVPGPARGRILLRACQLIAERKEDLARTLCREEGKIYKEALGEILKGLALMEFYAGEGFRLEGKTLPSESPNTFVYTVRQPLGVVSLICPWNFPWAIPVWKAAPALVAGNTVVLKPSDFTPLTAVKLAQIFHDAGLPKGAFNFLTGPGSVGEEMVRNPAVKAVSFTGSNAVGEAINRMAAERNIKVCCEMGGKNAAVVLDDANLDLAVAGVFMGAFGSTGQRCTATSRLILTRGVKEAFVSRLLEKVRGIQIGDGMDSSTTMGPIVNEAQMKRVLAYMEKGKHEGARLLVGGERARGPKLDSGWFVQPTLFDDVTPQMSIWREEIFGPVLSIATATGFEDALRLANDSAFGLTSAIYTENVSDAMKFVDGIECGMTHVNNPTIGGEAQLPFGGIKATGIGDREMAQEGLNFFTELKTVFIDFTGKPRQGNTY